MNPSVGPREIAVEIRHLIDLPMDVQADEQWSYVGSKKNQRWLWYAIDAVTGCVLSFVFGRRQDEVRRQLIDNLKVFNIRPYTDDWASDSALIPADKHVIGETAHPENRKQKPVVADTGQTLEPENHLFLKIGIAP